MPSSKVTLFFKNENHDGVYEVISYPKSEMEGGTDEQLADEMAALTHSVAWRRKQRRAVEPGDQIKIGKKRYVYTDGLHGTPLDLWPHLGIEEG